MKCTMVGAEKERELLATVCIFVALACLYKCQSLAIHNVKKSLVIL